MANKVGNLIKKARTEAGLTQEQLAKKVKNTSASDIGKAERGELKLSQDALKQIAKATGVTQKSLLDAAASSSYKSSSSSTKKATTTKKSTTKKATTGTTGSSMKVTATERKLVELYREADTSVKKKAIEILKKNEPVSELEGTIGSLIEGAIDIFTKR
ncbi:MAG: helix-turn-helix transcriptional regulator [Parasporobacterium sp.]|nr:helix-turn-helix transcriptional regulator [Parasporobacterium sp.]